MTKRKLTNYYWILFFIVQIYLIFEKIKSESFLVWNVVGLAASMIFLFYRFRNGRILKAYEQIILVFFIFNCISSFVYQFRIDNDLLKLILIPILAVLSATAIYLIKDFKDKTS